DDPVRRDEMASFLGRVLHLSPRVPPPAMVVAPYFYLDEAGHERRMGPFLAPFHRRAAEAPAIARASLESLLEGPTEAERISTPAVATFIPDGTVLNSVTIATGTATVDLSSDFAA